MAVEALKPEKAVVKQHTNIRSPSMELNVKVGCQMPCRRSHKVTKAEAGHLRSLTQPYFLSMEASGYSFLWLVCSMLFIVKLGKIWREKERNGKKRKLRTGLTLVLISGVLLVAEAASPEFAQKLVAGLASLSLALSPFEGDSGFIGMMFGMWRSPAGGHSS